MFGVPKGGQKLSGFGTYVFYFLIGIPNKNGSKRPAVL